LKYKEIIKIIENDGWYIKRQKGSHIIYKHKVKKGIVIIAPHFMNDDIPKGTENSILKQAGLK
jgi:predicted RNA binding protein YcfA (HicA-like mRNA interferase family)